MVNELFGSHGKELSMLDYPMSSMLRDDVRMVRGTMKETFADRLRDVIRDTGKSQAELARLVGRTRSTVNQWLNTDNNPTPENLFALAEGTGYSARWLATGQLPKKVSKDAPPPEALDIWERYKRANPETREAIDLMLGRQVARREISTPKPRRAANSK